MNISINKQVKSHTRKLGHGKGNLKRETESLLIASQNNDIRTNYVKPRIGKMQQNSKCRFCGDRDESINHIISECCKFAQREYKTRHDWVGKVIHWELCNKFKFDPTNKWYMLNRVSVQESEIGKILLDFEIKMYYLIFARRPDLVITIKKRTCRIVDIAVSADHWVKLKEREKRDRYLDFAREPEKL